MNYDKVQRAFRVSVIYRNIVIVIEQSNKFKNFCNVVSAELNNTRM